MKRFASGLILTTLVIAVAYSCGDGEDAVVPEPANRAPTPLGTIPGLEAAATDTAIVEVSGYFTDPDGHPLEYSASSSNTAVVGASVAANIVSLVAGIEKGGAAVTVTARDPGGLTATQSLQVTVVGKPGFLQVVLDYPERDVGALVLVVEGPALDSVAAGPDLDGYHVAVPGGLAAFIAGEIPQSGPILTFWSEDFTEARSYAASVKQAAGKDYEQRPVAGADALVVR